MIWIFIRGRFTLQDIRIVGDDVGWIAGWHEGGKSHHQRDTGEAVAATRAPGSAGSELESDRVRALRTGRSVLLGRRGQSHEVTGGVRRCDAWPSDNLARSPPRRVSNREELIETF